MKQIFVMSSAISSTVIYIICSLEVPFMNILGHSVKRLAGDFLSTNSNASSLQTALFEAYVPP